MGDSIISSFQRYEVKYFLTPEQRASLMPVLEAHFQMDEYAAYIPSVISIMTQTIMRSPGTPSIGPSIRRSCGYAPMASRSRRQGGYLWS